MPLADAWFNGWDRVGEVVASTATVYVGLVLLLRIGGTRTLSRLTVFDVVVSVAFGSTMATTIVSDTVSLVDGLVALALLVLLQTAVAFVGTRSERANSVVRGRPALLLHRGELLRDALRRTRVSEGEVLHALRASGVASPGEATAVVLERNGQLSVLTSEGEALEDVRR